MKLGRYLSLSSFLFACGSPEPTTSQSGIAATADPASAGSGSTGGLKSTTAGGSSTGGSASASYGGSPTPTGNKIAITSATDSTCVLLDSGGIQCWGPRTGGQLGIGMNPIVNKYPVTVVGITTAKAIASGSSHHCAILADKTVSCWGYNGQGQIGDGTTTDAIAPVAVTGIKNAIAIAGRYSTSCALLSDKTVMCWGEYTGSGSATRSLIPVAVTGITNAVAISGTCAVLEDGAIQCWGQNATAQLGNDTVEREPALVPVPVTGITTAKTVVSGGGYACALLSDKTIQCWGSNSMGQLGIDVSTTQSSTPTAVNGISSATSIALSCQGDGKDHTCAVLTNGTIQCWGYNGNGELGNGTTTNSFTPVPVTGITNAIAITEGANFSCALLQDHTVWCWGLLFASPTSKTATTPVQIVFP